VENLKRIFGILDDPVRIYYFDESREVEKEEVAYGRILHQIVFGNNGLVESLGPTWSLVADPRFSKIEAMMIVDRKAVFGGDSRLGVQYISENGLLSSSMGDLEKYAEILGEGRNFHNVLVHPDENCLVRRWLERIFKGYTLVRPHLSLNCKCKPTADPRTFKDAPDEVVWDLIGRECPNRGFDRAGAPTAYGTLMHSLIRSDLVGLIHDYAETPLIDSYIYLQNNGVVVAPEDVQKLDPRGVDHQRVLQEIDILEQALTHRAVLRVTAAKILQQMQVENELKNLKDSEGNPLQLTDTERDELLRIVYLSKWPDEKPELMMNIFGFIASCMKRPFAERQARQLADASNRSLETIEDLKRGIIMPINHYTEPVLEIPADLAESEVMRYAAVLDALTKNPLKGLLFQIYVAAEQEGEVGVLDILAPIFDPNYRLDEETYNNFLRAITRRARSLRVMEAAEVVPRGTTDTGVSDMDTRTKEGKLDIYGQRPNPDDPTKMQVKLGDGTWHDTKFPDPPKE
jgi:hypothetical protein